MSPNKKAFFNQVCTAVLWIAAIVLLLALNWWYLAAAILALHMVELFVTGYKRGIKAGYTIVETVTLTLVFGYTWWLYLEPR